MLDLEALGNGKNACIVQIGACYFDRDTGEIGETFKVNVCAHSATDSGAELDAQTVYWWLTQSREAIDSIVAQPRVDITVAMHDLNSFLSKAKCIWSHATFDFVIVTETFRRLRIKPLFSYSTCRDIRTLVDMAKLTIDKTERTGLHHDALADCEHQVKYCVKAFSNIKRRATYV